MILRSIALVLSYSAAGYLQESAAPDLEALRKELLLKFEGSGPVSGKLLFESVDAKGTKTLNYTSEFHIRPADSWMYALTNEIEENKPPNQGFVVYDGDGPVLAWKPGHDGYRVDYSLFYRATWQVMWDADRERNKVLGDPETFKTPEELTASRQPLFVAQMDPDPTGSPKAAFRFAMGKAEKGGASWLAQVSMLSKAEVVLSPDIVTLREAAPKRTTVIDRKTGFLRSIRIDFPTGEARLATVTEFARGTPKPEIRLPVKWRERKILGEAAAGPLVRELDTEAKKTLEMVLERWDRMKAPDQADPIRRYFAWYAGMQEALHRENARLQWASAYVKSVVEGGANLEDLEHDIGDWADKFGVYVKSGEKAYAANFTEYVQKLQKELLKRLAEAPGSDEARKALEPLIKEGFAPERLEKVRPKRPAPDYALLLRSAIDDAQPRD